MMDLKALKAALEQIEIEKNIPKAKILEAIQEALAAAYKKDYGKKGQIIRAEFDLDSGDVVFNQIKIAVDEMMIRPEDEEDEEIEETAQMPRYRASGVGDRNQEDLGNREEKKPKFNPEHHIMLDEAKKIKKDTAAGDEMSFPLESKQDYGRVASQTAKQVILQKIKETERQITLDTYKNKQGEIVNGMVQRIEIGNVLIDLGNAIAVLPREEQIRGERYRVGERTKAYLFLVEETPRGINLYLSRSHPKFVAKLFETEVPEILNGVIEIKNIAREAGSRSKIAVLSKQESIDAVGSCVGQKGTRVSTVINELGGEKIDIIEWSAIPETFISNSLSPAKITEVKIDEKTKLAEVFVDEDQLSLAIGKAGQNVRLAAKLTGWKIDIKSKGGEVVASATEEGEVVEEVKK